MNKSIDLVAELGTWPYALLEKEGDTENDFLYTGEQYNSVKGSDSGLSEYALSYI